MDKASSRALEIQLKVNRLQIAATMEKVSFPPKVVATYLRTQWRKDTIQVIEFKLVELTKIMEGSTGQRLGIRATTPCDVQVDSKTAKRVQRDRMPARPPRMYICHRCDEPLCAAADHLFWGTALDNARDCVLKNRHGRQRPGQFETPEAYVTHHTKRLQAKRLRLQRKL